MQLTATRPMAASSYVYIALFIAMDSRGVDCAVSCVAPLVRSPEDGPKGLWTTSTTRPMISLASSGRRFHVSSVESCDQGHPPHDPDRGCGLCLIELLGVSPFASLPVRPFAYPVEVRSIIGPNLGGQA